jgi:hypothetical protein
MQKWEYGELEFTNGGPLTGTKGTVWLFKPDGKHTQMNGNYGELCAKLGEAGWELVASSARIETGLGGKHKINYVFKRPLP